jgi:hypothetical protein
LFAEEVTMRRTELLQEMRAMRSDEAYRGWQQGRLRQEEAAQLLGVCVRTFRRYIDLYEESGLEGLIDRRLSQVSHRRTPVDLVMTTFDHPMVAIDDQQALGRGLLRRARGHTQRDLAPGLAGLLVQGFALDQEDLAHVREIETAIACRRAADPSSLDTAMIRRRDLDEVRWPGLLDQ